MAIRDRGIIKWAPFKSMPEQWSGLKKMYEDDKKVAKPILDEYQLEEINNFLLESLKMTYLYYSSYSKRDTSMKWSWCCFKSGHH